MARKINYGKNFIRHGWLLIGELELCDKLLGCQLLSSQSDDVFKPPQLADPHPPRGWLLSQLLHSYVALGMSWPFARDENLWSAKRPRSLLEQLGVGVKSGLIEDEDLGGDEPNCETNHQRAEREWF